MVERVHEVQSAPHVEHPNCGNGPRRASDQSRYGDDCKDGGDKITICCRNSEDRRKRWRYDPRNQKAESNEPKCVRNQQRDQNILRRTAVSLGKMYSFVTVPKATKLISTLSPNNAALSIDRLAGLTRSRSRFRGWLAV